MQIMDKYLAIITTVLVATQVIRVTQNTISLHRQNVLYKKQLKEVADWELKKEDLDMQRKAYRLLVERLRKRMSDKISDTVLNCPFCGGEAEFYRTPVKSNGGWCDSVVVRCKNCEARTNRVIYDARKHPNDEEYDEAAVAWNHRKPMERIVERLEEETKKAMSNSEKAAELGQKYEKHMIFYGAKGTAFEKAIEIVKEEGGLND